MKEEDLKRKLLKWILAWVSVGLLLPLLMLLRWHLFPLSGLGAVELALWPSSIALIGVGDSPTPYSRLDLAGIYAMLIAVNGLLYLVVGLVTSPVMVFVGRKWRDAR